MTEEPAGTEISPPVPVLIWLAAAELPLRLDKVTAKLASALTRVRRWPSLPATIPVMVWAAPEVSSLYRLAVEIATSLAEPGVV